MPEEVCLLVLRTSTLEGPRGRDFCFKSAIVIARGIQSGFGLLRKLTSGYPLWKQLEFESQAWHMGLEDVLYIDS